MSSKKTSVRKVSNTSSACLGHKNPKNNAKVRSLDMREGYKEVSDPNEIIDKISEQITQKYKEKMKNFNSKVLTENAESIIDSIEFLFAREADMDLVLSTLEVYDKAYNEREHLESVEKGNPENAEYVINENLHYKHPTYWLDTGDGEEECSCETLLYDAMKQKFYWTNPREYNKRYSKLLEKGDTHIIKNWRPHFMYKYGM